MASFGSRSGNPHVQVFPNQEDPSRLKLDLYATNGHLIQTTFTLSGLLIKLLAIAIRMQSQQVINDKEAPCANNDI